MKHPALTRVFAVVLVILCLVMLLAGAFGIRSAMDERLRGQEDHARLTDRIEEYRLITQALSGTVSYEEANKELEARQGEHDDAASQHRTDLATYTATRSGIQEGIAMLDEADAAFAAGKQKYLDSVKEFEKKEAEFNAGYQQFLVGKQQLADGWAQYNATAAAVQAAQAQLAGLIAISDILADEGIDDAEALQRAAIAAYDGAISNFDQALGVANSLKGQGGISAAQIQMLLGALAEEAGISLDTIVIDGVSAEQLQQLENAITEATGMTPQQIRDALVAGRSDVEGSDPEYLLTPEQFAAVREIYRQNRDLVLAAIQAVSSRLSQLSGTLESSRAQLAAAQAEMDQAEKLMAQGQAALEQGRAALEEAGREIEKGEAALYESRAQIWFEMGKLDEKEEELRQEKEALDQEAGELGEMSEKTQQQKDLEERETSVRLMLLSREGIEQRVDDGTALLAAAEDYETQLRRDIEWMYQGRMTAYVLMLAGALASFLALPAAFERIKNRAMLLIPVFVCLGCALGAEYICLDLGRGHSYSAIAVCIFAVIQLLIVLPRADKRKTD